MKNLKVIFLDWHGTLSTSNFWEHLQQPIHGLNHYSSIIDSIIFRNNSTAENLLNPWMRGELTTEEAIILIAELTDLDSKILLKEFIYSCQNMKFVSLKVPQMINNLREKGLKVVIATDNMDSFRRWTVPSLGLSQIFDDLLDSYNLRVLKKDIDSSGKNLFFQNYIVKNNIKPGESILIDDSEYNTVVQTLGIRYHRIPFGHGLINILEQIINNTY